MKVKVLGSAVVFESTIKFDDIKKVEKYRPSALTITDDDGNPVFAVCTAPTPCGRINKYGIEFGAASPGDGKYATVTLINPKPDGEGVKETVADMFGSAIIQMNKLELSLPSVLADIDAEREKIMGDIEIS